MHAVLHLCQLLLSWNGSFFSSAPPRGWERNAIPPPLLSPPQQVCPFFFWQTPYFLVHVVIECKDTVFSCWQSAEWCGPDGSVVLIRAVRSGLDRVVLELLQAGVPVNNTDHTGKSSLHYLLMLVRCLKAWSQIFFPGHFWWWSKNQLIADSLMK